MSFEFYYCDIGLGRLALTLHVYKCIIIASIKVIELDMTAQQLQELLEYKCRRVCDMRSHTERCVFKLVERVRL